MLDGGMVMARGVGTGFVLDSFGEPLDYFDSTCIRFELFAHCEGSIDLDCACKELDGIVERNGGRWAS